MGLNLEWSVTSSRECKWVCHSLLQVCHYLARVSHEARFCLLMYSSRKIAGYLIAMGRVSTLLSSLDPSLLAFHRWIRQLESKHITADGGLAEQLTWDIKRGRDFQNLAHMIYCCDGLPDHTLPTAQKMEKWMNREDSPPRQFQDDMDDVLRCLWLLATEAKYNQGFKKISQRIAPVEFIFIGLLSIP